MRSMECDQCDGPLGCEDGKSCCWARATAIRKFKKAVAMRFIVEVIFDLIISVTSVITDIISLFLYVGRGYYEIAVLTAIPVLLPTLVFTNVYLADETKGYCNMPKKRENLDKKRTNKDDEEKSHSSDATGNTFDDIHAKMDFHCGTCHFLCKSCSHCWGGIFKSCCHHDKNIRQSGQKMFKKSSKRIIKYFFGTFVLRFISIAWYMKALIFGVRAYREPKKYMRMALPTTHWSYDLLVKLDFLQAALENAPQCIIQLYALIRLPGENAVLGYLTLIFSFIDFVRISISVQWDVHKGPVIAPTGCYGTIMWKLVNIFSWICLYSARSAALALVIATANDWTVAIPVFCICIHVGIFAKLFSRVKFGVAAQKIIVSVFISIFFLPEVDSPNGFSISQFYYAVIHVQNLFFVVPWNGMEYDYCIGSLRTDFNGITTDSPATSATLSRSLNKTPSTTMPTTDEVKYGTLQNDTVMPKFLGDPDQTTNCLLDPVDIVIMVPTLTILGIVMRLAASKKMVEFKQTLPERSSTDDMVMEERIASIYNKRWASLSFEVLMKAFLKMLRKEVLFETKGGGGLAAKSSDSEDLCEGIDGDPNYSPDSTVYFISPSMNKEFRASQQFVRDAISFLATSSQPLAGRTTRSMSIDACGMGKRKFSPSQPGILESGNGTAKRCKSHENLSRTSTKNNLNMSELEENLRHVNNLPFNIEMSQL